MRRVLALFVALLMAALIALPAIAEAADAANSVAQAVETAAADAEQAAEQAADEVEQAAETAADKVEEAAEAVEEAIEETEEAVEEAVGEASPAPSPVFKKLLEQKWYTWVIVVALVVGGIVALAMGSKNANWTSRRIAMGAMCIAIAFVLSCIRLYRMPQGGSVTPACMLPLIMFMLACGPIQGLVVGCAYGLLQLISDPYVIHPIQLLVDYPLAFGAMILGCLAAIIPVKKPFKLPLAVVLGAIGRYFMASLSGAVFFSDVAGSAAAWKYSLGYNLSYLGPDTLVCVVIAFIPGMSRLVDVIRRK